MRKTRSVMAELSNDQSLRHHTKVKHLLSQLMSNAVKQWMRTMQDAQQETTTTQEPSKKKKLIKVLLEEEKEEEVL